MPDPTPQPADMILAREWWAEVGGKALPDEIQHAAGYDEYRRRAEAYRAEQLARLLARVRGEALAPFVRRFGTECEKPWRGGATCAQYWEDYATEGEAFADVCCDACLVRAALREEKGTG